MCVVDKRAATRFTLFCVVVVTLFFVGTYIDVHISPVISFNRIIEDNSTTNAFQSYTDSKHNGTTINVTKPITTATKPNKTGVEIFDATLSKIKIGMAYKSAKAKLTYCSIPKNACTLFRNLFVSIANDDPFIQNSVQSTFGKIHGEIGKFSWNADRKGYTDALVHKELGWKFFVVLRDPLERLLSSFLDKCIRNGERICLGPVTEYFSVFAQRYIKKIGNISRFDCYRDWFDVHFMPQHCFCGLHSLLKYYDTMILYTKKTVGNDTRYWLKSIGLERYYFKWGKDHNDTMFKSHSNYNPSVEYATIKFYQQYYDKHLAEAVMTVFEKDYELLNLPIPSWFNSLPDSVIIDPIYNFTETPIKVSTYIDYSHKICYCWIPQNAHSLFLNLFDELDPKGSGRSLVRTWETRPTMYVDYLKNKQSGWRFLVVLRDPLDRLLTGFLDECMPNDKKLCLGPKTTDFRVFVQRVIEKIGNGATFNCYKDGFQHIDDHFLPQHCFCGLHSLFEYYDTNLFFNYSTIGNDTYYWLKSFDSEEYYFKLGKYQNETMFDASSGHEYSDGYGTVEFYQKYYDKELAETVLDAFQKDYELLNISYPNWVKSLPANTIKNF